MSLIRAIEMAARYHADQTDKQGKPYILHCLRVGMSFDDELHQVVGILHDILEDTKINIELLRVFVSREALVAIQALTHGQNETYEDYIKRVAENPVAARVKIADLYDNLARMGGLPQETQDRLRPRYEEALTYLHQWS